MAKTSKNYVPDVALVMLQSRTSDDNIVSSSTNIIIGKGSGASIASSALDNIILGHESGNYITTGDNNIYIGNETGAQANESNKFRLGSKISASDLLVGTFGATTSNQSLVINGIVTCSSNIIISGNASITGNLTIKTTAPTTPSAGHIWIEGGALKFVSSGGTTYTINP